MRQLPFHGSHAKLVYFANVGYKHLTASALTTGTLTNSTT